jgi:2-(1,2-epoxy-1,2-dihydrophenyl)acetyl-CoA isomerase
MTSTESLLVASPSADPAGVRIISMNQPRRRNALSLRMRKALDMALALAMDDTDCRAVVLTGMGGYFCGGGDLTEATDGGHERFDHLNAIVRSVASGPKPVLAAVEGGAFGVGLSLASAADLVVSSTDATFGCSFIKVGLSCDGGASWTLPRRVGVARARRLMLTGEKFTAENAAHWGLVDYLAKPGEALDRAYELAAQLADGAPLAIQALRRLTADENRASLSAALSDEAATQSALLLTHDASQAIQAFLHKRAPAPFIGK